FQVLKRDALAPVKFAAFSAESAIKCHGGGIDNAHKLVHSSCMGKTITLGDDAYKLLVSLKQGTRDSFTKVVLRHIHEPATTNAELLEDAERRPPPKIDNERVDRLLKERGRRSGGRK